MADYLTDDGDTCSSNDPPPSGTHFSALAASTALGVPAERVDPRTLQLFQDLFPGEHGIQFLARLLRQAQVKQLALPQLGLAEVDNVAVICAQSMRVLAKVMNLGYDTVEKYIVLLCQLKLLHKQRSRRQIVLHFPLQAPCLPEPETLDHLETYRPKVAEFARQVKRRYVKLRASKKGDFYIARASRTSADPLVLMPAATIAENASLSDQVIGALLDDFDIILQQEEKVDPETKSRLFARLADAVRLRCPQGESRLSTEKGDFSTPSKGKDTQKKSTSTAEKGDFSSSFSQSTSAESCLSTQKDDFLKEAHPVSPIRKRRLRDQKGDSFAGPSVPKGDSDATKRQLSLEKGDFLSPKGDFDAKKATAATTNVNVILHKLLLNVNVRGNVETVARYLCDLFGEDPKEKLRYYVDLYIKNEYQNVEAWFAALIATAQASQQKKQLEKPGKYFYRMCAVYHQNDIPEQILQLMEQHRNASYQQLQAAFQQSGRAQGKEKQSQVRSRQAPTPSAIVPRVPRPSRSRAGIPVSQINALIKSLKTTEQTRLMRYAAYEQKDHSGILLVEDIVGCQRWICSLREWQAWSPSIQRSQWPVEVKNSVSGNYHQSEQGGRSHE